FSSDPPAPVGLVSRIPGAFEPRQRGNHWSVSVTSLAEAIPALLADLEAEGAKLEELSTRRAMLEDVFLALTGRELRDESPGPPLPSPGRADPGAPAGGRPGAGSGLLGLRLPHRDGARAGIRLSRQAAGAGRRRDHRPGADVRSPGIPGSLLA